MSVGIAARRVRRGQLEGWRVRAVAPWAASASGRRQRGILRAPACHAHSQCIQACRDRVQLERRAHGACCTLAEVLHLATPRMGGSLPRGLRRCGAWRAWRVRRSRDSALDEIAERLDGARARVLRDSLAVAQQQQRLAHEESKHAVSTTASAQAQANSLAQPLRTEATPSVLAPSGCGPACRTSVRASTVPNPALAHKRVHCSSSCGPCARARSKPGCVRHAGGTAFTRSRTGYPLTLNAVARAGCAVASMRPTRTAGACSLRWKNSATSSYTGAIFLQWPHHGACERGNTR